MLETIIDKINHGTKERLVAFFILWFAIYGTIWTIAEPLELPIVSKNPCLWRSIFIGTTFLINVSVYFFFLFRPKLESLSLEAGDTDLINSSNTSGSPKLTVQNDGFHGRILKIIADYGNDTTNWNVKASTHKAKFLTFTYKPEPDLMFYARVRVLSKNKKSSTLKWLRFEPTMSLPQSVNDDEEMGVPVSASNDNGLLRVNVNFTKTITSAFGNHGWNYDKIISLRVRGSGKIKNIIFK